MDLSGILWHESTQNSPYYCCRWAKSNLLISIYPHCCETPKLVLVQPVTCYKSVTWSQYRYTNQECAREHTYTNLMETKELAKQVQDKFLEKYLIYSKLWTSRGAALNLLSKNGNNVRTTTVHRLKRGLDREATKRPRLTLNLMLPPSYFTLRLLSSRRWAD